MAVIELTRGKLAHVDDADVGALASFSWVAVPSHTKHEERWYASAWNKGQGKPIYMHRLLLAAPKGQNVDHINHDGLDNRRINLRLCTTAQNNGNSLWPTGRSGFRGVQWNGASRMWQARISIQGRTKTIGYAACPAEAARIYDRVALQVRGEFAVLNFPMGG